METDELSAQGSFQLDVASNRRSTKWNSREMLGRILWELLRRPLFAWTPRPLWAWRCSVLRLFGAKIGRHVHVYPTVQIAVPWNLRIDDNSALGDGCNVYSLGSISIGRDATVSQGAHLCAGTHDYRRVDMPLLKPAIQIKDGCWVCADAFIGPGVTVGSYAIVGARAVVIQDIAPWMIVAGNPAKVVGKRPEMTPV